MAVFMLLGNNRNVDGDSCFACSALLAYYRYGFHSGPGLFFAFYNIRANRPTIKLGILKLWDSWRYPASLLSAMASLTRFP
jgi:hypothetical protein